ncbi:hypothetical protein V6N11_013169 [Hibiscus sabdariffa]|uniref:Uncharacterized protein n=2 Tax=Hibiscus sabdariffa TaxID=183260 RepID=A0ABR2NF58_9ROSI
MATSGNGPMFLKAVNCFGDVKDKFFIANLMKEVIDENICSAKNIDENEETYDLCNWITEIHGDAVQIKNFIMNHNMALVIFQRYSPLKLFSVADTRFASIIVMLKRFKLIKRALQAMVISDERASYREDGTGKANFVKEKLVSDDWWDKVAYIIDFTMSICDMLRL